MYAATEGYGLCTSGNEPPAGRQIMEAFQITLLSHPKPEGGYPGRNNSKTSLIYSDFLLR